MQEQAEKLKSIVETFLSSDVVDCEKFLEKIMELLAAYKKLLQATFSDAMSREDSLSQAEWALGVLGKKYADQCDAMFDMDLEMRICVLDHSSMPQPYASR